MKVLVYGTLKRGYGNNGYLRNAEFKEERVIKGYKLYNAGFPVATPSPNDSIHAELWELKPGDEATLRSLDGLEGVRADGSGMYDRVEIEEDTYIYVGVNKFWDNFARLNECPVVDGSYYWGR